MIIANKIKEITAERENTSFIEQVKRLRDEANVEYYDVDLINRTRTYVSNNERFQEIFDRAPFTFNTIFNEQNIKIALDRRRNKQSTYFEFLQDIAAAGVVKYRVDIKNGAVIYSSTNQEYTEVIPPHLLK